MPRLYELHAADIDDVLGWLVRRHRLNADDAEEFASEARLRLLEDDCRVLKQYEGRASLRSYLVVVLSNHLHDWRHKRWGRWRPSVAARRQGETAVHLERLLLRDGLTFDQAVETLRTNHGCALDRDDLYAMSLSFPPRDRQTRAAADALDSVAGTGTADAILLAAESAAAGRRVAAILARAISALDSHDQLVLKLVFEDNTPLTDVARILRTQYTRVYRQHRRVLERLGEALKREGVGSGAVSDFAAAQAASRLEALLQMSPPGPSFSKAAE